MNRYLKRAVMPFVMLIVFLLAAGLIIEKGTGGPEEAAVTNIVSERTLVPGGQSIGVKMDVSGVLITGLESIVSKGGTVVNPGKTAGLEVGDMILEINGKKVNSAEEVQAYLGEECKKLKIKVLRKGKKLATEIVPAYSREEHLYKLGIWIKDKTAGIGTLTYYDRQSGVFGALGHPIVDSETKTILNVEKGQLLKSRVESIKEGKAGKPGSVQGVFFDTDHPYGELKLNTGFGIFGILGDGIDDLNFRDEMPVAAQSQVHEGRATILTTLDNNEAGEYDIVIEKLRKQTKPETKSFVIAVTDEELLRRCGGIVQGMSGSPIIQDNRIVGAVTHVFVDDPTRGYGIYIQWMLDQCRKIV